MELITKWEPVEYPDDPKYPNGYEILSSTLCIRFLQSDGTWKQVCGETIYHNQNKEDE